MAHEETVYEALDHAHGGEGHWAFGTGFDEPLAGVDTTVPDGVDPADLGEYCLMLGDDALVLAQRLTQWVTAAPELEEEVAIANVALDLLGQARLLLARAGSVGVLGRSRRAGHRRRSPTRTRWPTSATPTSSAAPPWSRRPNGDFAQTMVRLLVAVHRPAGGLRPAARVPRPGAGRDRRQGRPRADLPPRPRRPLGAAARRRHRGVAPPRAGRRRRRLAAAGRRLHPHRRRAAADRGRRRRRPGDRRARRCATC